MAVRDIFKISWKTFINPVGWLDFEGLKNQNITIISGIKNLFIKPSPQQTETFEQACQRLGLTEEEIQASGQRYHLYAILFFILGLMLFFYSVYLIFSAFTFIGFILGISVSGLFFTYAFKYDFWAFQIKRRRLGASFNDWKRHILGEKGSSL